MERICRLLAIWILLVFHLFAGISANKSCKDDERKIDYCSLLNRLILKGEINTCFEIIVGDDGSSYYGARDCRKTCNVCDLNDEHASEETIVESSMNDINQIEITPDANMLLPSTYESFPSIMKPNSIAPSSSPTHEISTSTTFDSAIPTTKNVKQHSQNYFSDLSDEPSISSDSKEMPNYDFPPSSQETPSISNYLAKSHYPTSSPSKILLTHPTVETKSPPYSLSNKPTIYSTKILELPIESYSKAPSRSILPRDNEIIPDYLSSNYTSNCIVLDDNKDFCEMIARYLIRGKNVCKKKYFHKHFNKDFTKYRQGTRDCQQTCGTCPIPESEQIPSAVPQISNLGVGNEDGIQEIDSLFYSSIDCDGTSHELLYDGSQRLYKGDYICSPNGRFAFGVDLNGDVCIVDVKSIPLEKYWTLGTQSESNQTFLDFQSDGNLVLYQASGESIWSTKTKDKRGNRLFVTNFGTAFIGTFHGKAIWASYNEGAYLNNDYVRGCSGSSTLLRQSFLLPGQYICSGEYKFGLSLFGDIGIWDGNIKLWSSNTGVGENIDGRYNFIEFDYYALLTVWSYGENRWRTWPDNDSAYKDAELTLSEMGQVYIKYNNGASAWSLGISTCSRVLGSNYKAYNGQLLCSAYNMYQFGLKNGNLSLFYHGIEVWSANVSNGWDIKMQDKGSLVVRDDAKNVVWSTDTDNPINEHATLLLQDDGRIIISDEHGHLLWSQEHESVWNETLINPSAVPSSIQPINHHSDTVGRSPHATYIPGELSVYENGLLLSTGLTSTIIATSGEKVNLTGNQTLSDEIFHIRPDGAAIFPHTDGGWMYVSNSEGYLEEYGSTGGVGLIEFDNHGNVVDYRTILQDTNLNCGGGKTPWDTWLSCEEISGGSIFEVDPYGRFSSRSTAIGGDDGGRFESVAFDNRSFPLIHFFVTEDDSYGVTRRFTPYPDVVMENYEAESFENILIQEGTTDYLILVPLSSHHGSFYWTNDLEFARENGHHLYRNSEGLDAYNGKLYMTSKAFKVLYILDLDNGTYEASLTHNGAFEGQPDQVARLSGAQAGDLLYFCEDSQEVAAGVHGRDRSGKFFTVLEGIDYDTESTGLAFSPDNMFMYVSFQDNPGLIVSVKRLDELPFHGNVLDIKYHSLF